MKSEAEVQREIINYLLENGWAVLRINTVKARKGNEVIMSYITYPATLTDGCSDLIAFRKHRAIFREVKTEKGSQSKNQVRFEEWCRHYGLDYKVVRSTDTLDLPPPSITTFTDEALTVESFKGGYTITKGDVTLAISNDEARPLIESLKEIITCRL